MAETIITDNMAFSIFTSIMLFFIEHLLKSEVAILYGSGYEKEKESSLD